MGHSDTEKINLELLAKNMINGDLEARDKLLEHYTNLVTEIVEKIYSNQEFNKQELISAGIEGIKRALNSYNSQHKSYFCNYIYGYILNDLRAEANRQLNKGLKTYRILMNDIRNGNTYAKNLYIDKYIDYVIQLIEAKYNNYDDYIKEDLIQKGILEVLIRINSYKPDYKSHLSGFTLNAIKYHIKKYIEKEIENLNIDYIGLNNRYVNVTDLNDIENLIAIKAELEECSEKEKQILYLHIYKNYTFEEIGKVYNISKQRIEQIYKKCTKKIREKLIGNKINNPQKILK